MEFMEFWTKWYNIYLELDPYKCEPEFPKQKTNFRLAGQVTKVQCVRYLEKKHNQRVPTAVQQTKKMEPNYYQKTVELTEEYDMNSDGFLSFLECFCLLPELEKALPQPKDTQPEQNVPQAGKGSAKPTMGKWGKAGKKR